MVVPLPQGWLGGVMRLDYRKGVENEIFSCSHFGSGGGDTAPLVQGFVPVLCLPQLYHKIFFSSKLLFILKKSPFSFNNFF